MTNNELLTLLSFEKDLESVNIISQSEIEEDASHIVAELNYADGTIYKLPFIWYQGKEWIFTPYDWQSYPSILLDDIESIQWRVNNTEDEGIMINGLPRLFV